MDIYGYIYIIKNIKNNKLYIGQTTRCFKERYPHSGTNIEKVYKYHKANVNHKDGTCNKHLLNSIEKHGYGCFEIIEEFDIAYSEEELNKLEYMYIRVYDSINPKYGYNRKLGGDNHTHSEDSLVKKGYDVICVNDSNVYKSYTEASEFYDVPWMYVKKSALSKKFYSKNYALLRFKKLKRPLNRKIEKVCVCCGKIIKIKSNTQKYCDKCRCDSRKIKDKPIDLTGMSFKKVYYYEDLINRIDNNCKTNNNEFKKVSFTKSNKINITEEIGSVLIKEYFKGTTYKDIINALGGEVTYEDIVKYLKSKNINVVNRDKLKSMGSWEEYLVNNFIHI